MSDVEKVMEMAKAPSISVGVLHNGEVLFKKSIGLRNVEENLKANSDTSYLIASCSKMITATALSLLVEEKKVKWEDTIRTHLPSFDPVEDPEIGNKATLIDASRHSTGLANPNVVYMGPEGIISNTADDHIAMVNALPSSNKSGQRFRNWWYYSNATFGLMPLVIEAVSNSSYADFLKKRILEPLGLQQTLLYEAEVEKNDNLAFPYAPQSNGTWARIQTRVTSETHGPVLGSQGIRSSVNDLLAFLAAVMNRYDEEKGMEPQQPLLPTTTFNPLRQIVRMWNSWWTRPIDDGFQNETAYTLGWYRTTIPTAALGLFSINRYANAKDSGMKEIIGRDSEPRTLYGNNGNANGSNATVYILPASHTAIVALSNASDTRDAAEAASRILLQAVFDLKPQVDFLPALHDAGNRRFKSREEKIAEWERHRNVTQYTGCPEDFLGTYVGLSTSRINIINRDAAPAQVAVQFADNTHGICDLEPYNADALSFLPTDNDSFLARGMLDWDYWTVGVFEFVRDDSGEVIAFWWQWEETDWPGLWVRQKEGMAQQDVQSVIEKLGRFRKSD